LFSLFYKNEIPSLPSFFQGPKEILAKHHKILVFSILQK